MDLIERLRRIELFSRLTEDDLWAVADLCEERVVPPDTRLVRQADMGSTFFIIDQGEAIVHRVDAQGYQRPVGVLHAGDSFGLTSLFISEPRDATVSALTEMRLWTLRRGDLQGLLDQHPRLYRQLLIPESVRAKLRAPRYIWLEPGETVVYHSRRHWFSLVHALAFSTSLLAMYALAVISLVVFAHFSRQLLLLLLPGGLLYAGAFIWYWVDWRNDYYAVSTRRVIHHEQIAFIYESRNEAPIDRVQNVNASISFWGKVLNYGDLSIQTAAEVGTILFDQVPDPDRMTKAIFDEIERARATRRAVQRQRIREALATHIEQVAAESTQEIELAAEPPLEFEPKVESPEASPSGLSALLGWLTRSGLVPVTRIETVSSITWRKHWIFMLAATSLPFTLSFLLGLITLLGFFGQPAPLVARFPFYPYLTFVLTIVCLGWLWWNYHDWGNDLYILTDERIIDLDKKPLFAQEERREASLGMIQNVSLKVPSIIAALFNFGDVVVQTAGAAGAFTFLAVPNPREVQREIFRRMEAYREREREREANRRRAEIAEWFGVYEELHGGQKPPPPPPRPGPETPPPDRGLIPPNRR